MSAQDLAKEIVVDITQEEYEADLALGLSDDEVLKPGRHNFRRGGFLARHGIQPEQSASIKRRLLLKLDLDIFTYLEEQTDGPQALHAQINNILRKAMEIEQGFSKK